MNYTKGKWFSHYNGTYIELLSDCPDGELLSWTVIGDVCASKYAEIGDVGAANAKRIVDCVNACDGMENPADEIAKLRGERDAAIGELSRLADAFRFFIEDGERPSEFILAEWEFKAKKACS